MGKHNWAPPISARNGTGRGRRERGTSGSVRLLFNGMVECACFLLLFCKYCACVFCFVLLFPSLFPTRTVKVSLPLHVVETLWLGLEMRNWWSFFLFFFSYAWSELFVSISQCNTSNVHFLGWLKAKLKVNIRLKRIVKVYELMTKEKHLCS